MMKLYSEYGINPASGCLPLLLQMPILFALWSVLRTQIDLRQADFIWWITDLSLPDVLVHLPFSLLGIKFISGLALLMGITMFLQQKLTITDPRQKAMIYIMPVMFTMIFSSLPSGLNLYYFMFNLFSIVQQVYINNYSKNRPTLAQLKKAPKKEGWFQKKMREAQNLAESQGRSVPGRATQSYKKKQVPKKKK
jgi:YidC/Oxa1 family membrane protein insertase